MSKAFSFYDFGRDDMLSMIVDGKSEKFCSEIDMWQLVPKFEMLSHVLVKSIKIFKTTKSKEQRIKNKE
jgi:hypothetical protein